MMGTVKRLFHRHEWVMAPQSERFVEDGLALGLPVASGMMCRKCGECSCGRQHGEVGR